jgi:hypothetical protein
MCVLPIFKSGNLAELENKGKRGLKKTEAEDVDVIIPEENLKNSI